MTIRVSFILMIALCLTVQAGAAKIHSNGLGGGAWDEPTTWHSNAVPTATDEVVISRNDHVTYSLAPEGAACAKLLLDPEAALQLKPLRSSPSTVFRVTGPIDCYGTIQADLAARPDASVTITLGATEETHRVITLREGGALLMFGAPDPLDGKRNVTLRSRTADEDVARPDAARVNAMKGSSLDLRWTTFRHVSVDADSVDNTGYESGARLNIAHNHFLGESRISLLSCDTPIIANNVFEAPRVLGGHAIQVRSCAIATVANNRISGSYNSGIAVVTGKDCRVAGNTIEVQRRGITLYSITGVVQNNTIRGGLWGIHSNLSTPTIERGLIRVAEEPIVLEASDAHLNSVVIDPAVEDMPWLTLDGSRATLLNMAMTADQVKVIAPPKRDARPIAQAFAYCVARVNGRIDRSMRLDARTVGAPADRADLNVRHAPVRIGPDGFSALPGSRAALELLTWSIAFDGTITAAPRYNLRVISMPDDPSAEPRVLSEQEVQPNKDWLRADPDALTATVEVHLR